jgi:hypothetical protein
LPELHRSRLITGLLKFATNFTGQSEQGRLCLQWCIMKMGPRIIKLLSVLTIAVLCASCRTDSSPDLSQDSSILSKAELNAREDCLHQEVARLLEPRGSPLSSLQTIAVTAASFCSYTIAARLRGVSASAAREDQVKTEEHAFVIGLEMRERRASR